MDLVLKDFQEDAKEELLTALASGKKDITMQAPTGSGKTIILCKMVEDYFATVSKKVVVWLTPGNGELEEQSLNKFQKFLEQPCKTLDDALRGGINEENIIFINWEQLNKTGAKALRDQETKNLKERIEEAINNGLSFTVIVDEAHRNATNKSDNILDLLQTIRR
jgi:type III restriction enzyme